MRGVQQRCNWNEQQLGAAAAALLLLLLLLRCVSLFGGQDLVTSSSGCHRELVGDGGEGRTTSEQKREKEGEKEGGKEEGIANNK